MSGKFCIGSSSSRPAKESGATFLEFAIVAPLVLFLILAIAETARYIAVRGMVTAAANRAVLLAASDPGIGAYNIGAVNSPLPVQDPAYTDSVQKVVSKAKELPASLISVDGDGPGVAGFISDIQLIPPQPDDAGDSVEKRFEDVPLLVQVTVTMRPIIPCLAQLVDSTHTTGCSGPFTVTFTAAAFREPSKVLTMPTQVDCNGNPIGSPNYNQNCACKSLQYWDTTTPPGQCICLSGLVMDSGGNCACADSRDAVNTEGVCNCDTAKVQANCNGPGQIVDPVSCNCVCDAGSGYSGDGSSCQCTSSAQQSLSGKCQCANPLPCDPANGSVWDETSCQCVCNADAGFTGSGTTCQCASSDKSNKDNAGSCVCTNTSQCPGYQSWDPNACNCGSCPGDTTYWWIKSNCEAGGGVWDSDSCQCSCPSGTGWQSNGSNGWCGCSDPNKYFDGTQCVCDWAMTDNGAGGCKCTDSNKDIINGWCQCTNLNVVCPNSNQKVDPNTCSCECLP